MLSRSGFFRRAIACAYLCVAVASTAAQAQTAVQSASKPYLEAGWAALEARDFDKALSSFDTALATQDRPAEAQVGRARALAGLGRTDAALRLMERLATSEPGFMLEHAAILLIAERPEPALSLLNRSAAYAQAKAKRTAGRVSQRFQRRLAFLRGEALYLLGGYSEAQARFEDALKLGGGAAEWRAIGDTRFAMEQYDAADDAYARALELRRYDGMAMQRRARLRFLERDYGGALEGYENAEVSLDDDTRLLAEHAEALVAAGAPADAVALLRRLLKRTPSDAPYRRVVLYHLASALISSGRPREAEAVLARIGPWAEASVAIRFLQGRARAATGDAEGAVRNYSAALAERPGDPDLLYNRALVRLQLDQRERALDDLSEAAIGAPGNPRIRDAIGRIKLDQGRYDEGLAFYNAAVAAQPDAALPLTQRANALLAVGVPQNALDDANDALALEPDNLGATEAAAKALIMLDRDADAIAHADRLIDSRTGKRSGYLLRARAAIGTGDINGAFAAIEQARNFGAPEWRLALLQGDAHARAEEFDRAAAAYDRAALLKPTVPSIYARRGDVYFANGAFDAAVRDYRLVLDRVPRDLAHRMKLGMALRKAGRNDEAIAEFNRVLELQPDNDQAHGERGKARIAMGSYLSGLGDLGRSMF